MIAAKVRQGGIRLLRLTRNRPRAAMIALPFIIVLLAVPLLALLFAAPALAAAPEGVALSFSYDPAVIAGLALIVGLLLLKLILGIAIAIKDKAFDARKLPDILKTNVLPYLLPVAAMAALSLVLPDVKAVYFGFFGTGGLYVVKLAADVKDSAVLLFGLSAPPDAPTPSQTE